MSINPPRRSGSSIIRRHLLGCLASVLLTAPAHLAVAAAPGMPAGLNAPAKPTLMPAFDLPTVAGSPLRSESLKGQVLVVRFWASW